MRPADTLMGRMVLRRRTLFFWTHLATAAMCGGGFGAGIATASPIVTAINLLYAVLNLHHALTIWHDEK